MRIRWRDWVGAAALVVVIALPAQAQVFNPQTKTLGNGLQVVVVENHRAPIVSHMVWYKVGAADETAGKSGIAHFLEHLMFKGTPDIPPGQFSKIVARNGGRDNAFTSSDYTAYFQNIAVDRLELVMKMEADRMRHLTLDEANVKSELEVVKEERRSRTDNDPGALLRERMEAALFLNHPYRRPVIGWPDELNGLTRADALAYYQRWYAPNNAIVIVAGDVLPDQVFALAEQYYGPLQPEDIPARVRPAEPPQAGARQITITDARVSQPSWTRIYVAPSEHSAVDKSHPQALEVLSEILSGGATGRLYKSLVVDQGLAASAQAGYDGNALDQGTFSFYASPRPGIAMDKLERAMVKEITRLRQDGVSAAEVAGAKTRLKASIVYARDSLHTAAQTLGTALTTGQSIADVEDWPNRIAAITVDQVNAAARAVLDDNASVTGLLLPVPGAKGRQAAAPSFSAAKEIVR